MADFAPLIVLIALIVSGIPVAVTIIRASRKGNGSGPPSAPGQTLQPPTTATGGAGPVNGRYEIKSQPYKQGGMATIWLAKERGTNRTCIIKTPRRGTNIDNVYLDKLMQEAGYLKGLNHPNLVKYLDDFYLNGEFHLVIEYINGETIMPSAPRSCYREEKVVAWACQVLDALSYIHSAGIVHRDVNPKNIMLTSEGAIKLIDFGTAKGLSGSKREPESKDPFTQIANKGFDIPELFMGGESDQRCDLCGVAQTCIYLLTLRQPNDLCYSLINSNWPRSYSEAAAVANCLISGGMSKRTARCLAQGIMFSPGSRFAGAHAMQAALSPASIRPPGNAEAPK
jgi:serine/threonine-protein kinase